MCLWIALDPNLSNVMVQLRVVLVSAWPSLLWPACWWVVGGGREKGTVSAACTWLIKHFSSVVYCNNRILFIKPQTDTVDRQTVCTVRNWLNGPNLIMRRIRIMVWVGDCVLMNSFDSPLIYSQIMNRRNLIEYPSKWKQLGTVLISSHSSINQRINCIV